VHAEPSHWLHEISISKTIHHHFWPGGTNLLVLVGTPCQGVPAFWGGGGGGCV